VRTRVRGVVASGAFPWHWSAQLIDKFLGDLRAVRNLKRSTLSNYQERSNYPLRVALAITGPIE
jgi:hypothetical protein